MCWLLQAILRAMYESSTRNLVFQIKCQQFILNQQSRSHFCKNSFRMVFVNFLLVSRVLCLIEKWSPIFISNSVDVTGRFFQSLEQLTATAALNFTYSLQLLTNNSFHGFSRACTYVIYNFSFKTLSAIDCLLLNSSITETTTILLFFVGFGQ